MSDETRNESQTIGVIGDLSLIRNELTCYIKR